MTYLRVTAITENGQTETLKAVQNSHKFSEFLPQIVGNFVKWHINSDA